VFVNMRESGHGDEDSGLADQMSRVMRDRLHGWHFAR